MFNLQPGIGICYAIIMKYNLILLVSPCGICCNGVPITFIKTTDLFTTNIFRRPKGKALSETIVQIDVGPVVPEGWFESAHCVTRVLFWDVTTWYLTQQSAGFLYGLQWYLGGYGTQVTSHECSGMQKGNFRHFLNITFLREFLSVYMYIYIWTVNVVWCAKTHHIRVGYEQDTWKNETNGHVANVTCLYNKRHWGWQQRKHRNAFVLQNSNCDKGNLYFMAKHVIIKCTLKPSITTFVISSRNITRDYFRVTKTSNSSVCNLLFKLGFAQGVTAFCFKVYTLTRKKWAFSSHYICMKPIISLAAMTDLLKLIV